MKNTEEIPNTKNVVIWPEKILNEIRMVERFDADHKEIIPVSNVKQKSPSLSFYINESVEYYMFVILGSIIWCVVARSTLIALKFPFHKHFFEVIIIYTVPIFIFMLVFYLLDITVPSKKKED